MIHPPIRLDIAWIFADRSSRLDLHQSDDRIDTAGDLGRKENVKQVGSVPSLIAN